MIDKSTNAGVHAQTGFALQRNSALFLLLESYFIKFNGRKYFICLEHQDDFIFCFLDEDDKAELIEAFQSKMKASDIWRANPEMFGIIKKLLKTGKALLVDPIPKSLSYNHVLYFSTNQTINLEHRPLKSENKPFILESIKADNKNVSFQYLDIEIQNKFTQGISDNDLHKELKNLSFLWIPFTNTVKEQENQLVGKIDEIFGNKIFDHRAAVNLLISLFRDIEVIYNQGSVTKLLDQTKRVDNKKIEEAVSILTKKSKCFDHWHNQKQNVSHILNIKPVDKDIFELDFSTAFDLFKSLEEAEYRKILQFCRDNIQNLITYTEEENLFELFTLFTQTQTSTFEDLELKAIFFAAYFEAIFKTEN